jgi:hypothetical protein
MRSGSACFTHVSRCDGLSGSARESPPLTGRSGTQRARHLRPRATLDVLVALVLVVFRYLRERALPWGVHPLAVGHPPGSGLGLAGEGGAPYCLTDLRPRGQVC